MIEGAVYGVSPWQGVAMNTRSMLVYYPGYPFDWGVLTPQRAAASAAGSLIEAGHDCVVRDYGTLDTIERLTPPNADAVAKPTMDRIRNAITGAPLSGLAGYVEVARVNARFRKRQQLHCAEIGESLAREPHLGFIAFLVQTPDDAHCVNQIASAIKAHDSGIPLIAFGSFIEQFGTSLHRAMPHLDWLCDTEPELCLPEFAAVSRDRSQWSTLQRLALAPAQRWTGPFASLPDPVYSADMYPAVADQQKLLIFEVEDSISAPDRADNYTDLHLRPVEDICSHIWQLRAQFGAGLIRFTGRSTPALHFRSILNGLARRGVDILYSRRYASAADASFFPSEFASGCVLHTHEIFSGSQWLHDRFYRSGSTITQMESLLHASKDAGIETVAELTYPCPADDYHTRDETLRLIRRTIPHAANVRLPHVTPSSRWMNDAKRHGFEIPRSGLAARALKCLSMYPLARHQWDRAPYGIRGRGPAELQNDLDNLRTDMAELGVHPFDGEIASLVRAASSAANGRPTPVPAYIERPFIELDTFIDAVDSCRGMAAASRENGLRAASAGLRPVAGDG